MHINYIMIKLKFQYRWSEFIFSFKGPSTFYSHTIFDSLKLKTVEHVSISKLASFNGNQNSKLTVLLLYQNIFYLTAA